MKQSKRKNTWKFKIINKTLFISISVLLFAAAAFYVLEPLYVAKKEFQKRAREQRLQASIEEIATQSPIELNYKLLRRDVGALTDSQWDILKKAMTGKRVTESGWLKGATEKNGVVKLSVDMEGPNRSSDAADVTVKAALPQWPFDLQKDQKFTFTGVVNAFDRSNGRLRIVLEPAIIGQINPLVLKELKNNAKLQAHALAIKKASPSRTLAGGPKNKNVLAWAQAILKEDSLYKGKIDGIYGPKTRAAIESFQTQHGLDQTGKIDPLTFSKLKEVRAE